MLVVLALVLLDTGCSMMGAAIVHKHEVARDRRSRGNVRSLELIQPGTMVTIKQSDTLAVTGRFTGFAGSDSASATPFAAAPNASILLRVGWRSRSIPAARVEWVQVKSSPHIVLLGFGAGFIVDATVIYLIGRSFAGLD